MSTVAKRRAVARAIARKKAAKPAIYNMPYVQGRGAYRRRRPAYQRPTSDRLTLPSTLGSMLGGAAGTFVGGPLGGVIGSGIGHLAQGLLKHVTGFGDYRVEVNTLMGEGFSPPELINMSKNGFCVRHREYIGDITASANFTINSYDINPGASGTFPWLSGVAENFEEYMITGMIFEFKTLSADYTTAASAALGYVAMATQYNSLLPAFPDKIHLENYEFANSAKPSETFIHPIECKRALNPVSQLYVRTGPVESNADQRLYDLGKFQIATGGNSGTGVLGELWCTYEICLYKPKLVEADDEILSSHWHLTSVTDLAPFGGGAAVLLPGSTLQAVPNGTSLTFPSTLSDGLFYVSYYVIGTSAIVKAPTTTALFHCSLVNGFYNNLSPYIGSPVDGANSQILAYSVLLHVTGPSAVLVFSDDGLYPVSITGAELWVTQVNDDIT